MGVAACRVKCENVKQNITNMSISACNVWHLTPRIDIKISLQAMVTKGDPCPVPLSRTGAAGGRRAADDFQLTTSVEAVLTVPSTALVPPSRATCFHRGGSRLSSVLRFFMCLAVDDLPFPERREFPHSRLWDDTGGTVTHPPLEKTRFPSNSDRR